LKTWRHAVAWCRVNLLRHLYARVDVGAVEISVLVNLDRATMELGRSGRPLACGFVKRAGLKSSEAAPTILRNCAAPSARITLLLPAAGPEAQARADNRQRLALCCTL
jgi:hypothetical protein